MGYWAIRNPWGDMRVTDEFGAGTLDGASTDGPSFDACACAAIENGAAAYERRDPTYANIGHIRADMIANHEWTQPALVGNPRTAGCYIEDVAWEIPRRGYLCPECKPDTGTVPTADDVRGVLNRHGCYTIFIVVQAHALPGNEAGVYGHFVGVAAYDSATDKVLVLNSDVAGQHGLAPGQWMTLDQFMAAQPMGWAVMAPKPATPPPPPTGGTPVAVPSGWKDDGTTLTAPNGTAVTLGFRQFILSYPGGWPAMLWPAQEFDSANNSNLCLSVMLHWEPGQPVTVHSGALPPVPPAPPPDPKAEAALKLLQAAVALGGQS